MFVAIISFALLNCRDLDICGSGLNVWEKAVLAPFSEFG
jgi:hypothetical protein